ncbi:hypothetical protein AcV5_005962 [Taiwanofungus camphoratus]|nr:hypothetical protein AcV5_005962 [Antrodia cinnamomea]
MWCMKTDQKIYPTTMPKIQTILTHTTGCIKVLRKFLKESSTMTKSGERKGENRKREKQEENEKGPA